MVVEEVVEVEVVHMVVEVDNLDLVDNRDNLFHNNLFLSQLHLDNIQN
jgi:hypothetical protein